MFKFASDFWTSKTTWTAAISIGVATYQFLHGAIDANAFYLACSASFALAFHRDTKAKHSEADTAGRAAVIYAATKAPPSIPLNAIEAALAAHVSLHQEGLKAAVAGAVETVLHQFLNVTDAPPAITEPEDVDAVTEPHDGEVDRG
jgi:hypothetical protein